ncbi:hypothetical protein [Brachybacterium fresconis]|uniref:Uncharacterized protein n=1 Tax=Brachybacterium fresconis TaxID=173363 RepID=A0ABS4YK88_9MICO|nr:hypothetical protein [Brachybacterium fresconis]MBP2409144.1 hypothetical protein [Brachybacterium fresconis]
MDTTYRPLRLLLLLATLSSLISAGLGIRWLLAPDTSALTAMAIPPPLLTLIGPGPMYAAQMVVALLGVATGAALLAVHEVPGRIARLVAVVGAAQVLLFGLGFASFTTLAGTGYLLALVVPVIVVACGIALLRGGGPARRAVGAGILLLLVLGLVVGREVVGHVAGSILPVLLADAAQLLVTAHVLVEGAVWAAVVVLALRTSGTVGRVGDWTRRHRRALTLLAACGPLPYALARLTWLTPWPVLGGSAAEMDVTTRVWGLMLSTGAWLGVLLTIGLIRPWGETFPRWFPAVGGRPVPIATAAIPGFTVAALLCFAAVPVVLSAATIGPVAALAFALAFPCWFWGPMLALAVWGYIGHRRSTIDPRAGDRSRSRMGA